MIFEHGKGAIQSERGAVTSGAQEDLRLCVWCLCVWWVWCGGRRCFAAEKDRERAEAEIPVHDLRSGLFCCSQPCFVLLIILFPHPSHTALFGCSSVCYVTGGVSG